MSNTFVMSRRVEFVDTDMAGIVHFTAFFRYMETAEHELFRDMGLSITGQWQGRQLGWPRVSCSFDFFKALRFPEEFEVHLIVAHVGDKSVTYEAQIVRDGTVLARGRSTCTCCEIDPTGALRPVAIPLDIAEKLRRRLEDRGQKTEDRGQKTEDGGQRSVLCILFSVFCFLSSVVVAADWPRFLGPNANSISPETGINKDWGQTPPKEYWRITMTDGGFSGPAVSGGIVYLHDHKGEEDVIRAVNAANGEEKWRFTYAEKGPENHGYTRATPTVEHGCVYTVSRAGVVHCLDAGAGRMIWRVDAMSKYGGEPPEWGAANSAVIDGEKLITIAAGENAQVVALDKRTGAEIWAGGGTDIAGYATPVVGRLDGRRQYLIFTGKSIIGVAPEDGALLWRYPWETRLDSNACSPIIVGDDSIWIASGYRRGCALLRVNGDQVEEVWADRNISPHWSSGVLIDGYIYTTTMPGYLVCVEAASGREKWRSRGTGRGFEHGGLCAVDGTLIVIEGNTGNVVQTAISTEAYVELGRINPLESSHCWVAPVVADKMLYVRSPQELVCLDIGRNDGRGTIDEGRRQRGSGFGENRESRIQERAYAIAEQRKGT